MSLVSLFTFISPVSSTMIAPALTHISSDLHITTEFLSELVLSSFILVYAFGPLFLGPLSENHGRVRVLQVGYLFYFAFNLGCGFAQTTGQMIAFRFLSGIGGSVPLAKSASTDWRFPSKIGGGVLGDTFRPEDRGTASAVYSLAPLLGPALGPIFGGFIAEKTTWRWVFYATSTAVIVLQFAGLFILRETYPPYILRKRAKKIREETGDHLYQTTEERQNKTLAQGLKTSPIRPFRLLFTQPIIQVLSVYMAYVYGLQYLMLSTFPSLWTDSEYYGESIGIGGLNYISLGFGALSGSLIAARLNDYTYANLKARNNGSGKTEFRLPLLAITSICCPIGLFIYGWTAQTHQPWIAPNIGACIFGVANMISFQCMQTYTVDTYTKFAASAMASVSVLRSICAFAFPLFAPYLYNALDYGWGNSVLAFISIAIGFPVPIFLWVFGERLRKASPYAAG
ncbi:MFS multidrug transporter [Penicillium angulare]|uniref:MFS multidrug transporter n=1 Tax=Penicillium angulare TaxID=116970 RepID=A0A9W9EGC0_9EURO|nr:MFS multidrug transporter [Penicillium angulare]